MISARGKLAATPEDAASPEHDLLLEVLATLPPDPWMACAVCLAADFGLSRRDLHVAIQRIEARYDVSIGVFRETISNGTVYANRIIGYNVLRRSWTRAWHHATAYWARRYAQ